MVDNQEVEDEFILVENDEDLHDHDYPVLSKERFYNLFDLHYTLNDIIKDKNK
jgi:hypothetical protein